VLTFSWLCLEAHRPSLNIHDFPHNPQILLSPVHILRPLAFALFWHLEIALTPNAIYLRLAMYQFHVMGRTMKDVFMEARPLVFEVRVNHLYKIILL